MINNHDTLKMVTVYSNVCMLRLHNLHANLYSVIMEVEDWYVPYTDISCGYCGYRYKRVFAIGTKAIGTLNPNNHDVTNQVRIA